MNGATSVLLAALLVLSIPAVAVTANGPAADPRDASTSERIPDATFQAEENRSVIETNDTTNRLSLTGEVRSEYGTYEPDLGMALAATDDAIGIDYEQHVLLDDEFDDASFERREELLAAAYDRLEQRTAALEERERTAVREHASGDRSDTELLRVLVRNYNEANAIAEAREQLREREGRIPGELSFESGEQLLEFHRTPIVDELASTDRSSWADQEEIRIRTSRDGYSLATISSGRYVVETTRFDNRDADAENQFDGQENQEILDRIYESYPRASEASTLHFTDNSEENLYATSVVHDQGTLEVYLDGGTGEIHREVQELWLSSLPSAGSENVYDDELSVTVNHTPGAGPAELFVNDIDTGDPVAATVSIDGETIGETGDDGLLWILPPAGEYEVDVETDDGSTNGTVSLD